MMRTSSTPACLQPGAGHEPGEAAADEGHGHLVEQGLALHPLDVGILEEAANRPVGSMYWSLPSDAFVPLLAVPGPQRVRSSPSRSPRWTHRSWSAPSSPPPTMAPVSTAPARGSEEPVRVDAWNRSPSITYRSTSAMSRRPWRSTPGCWARRSGTDRPAFGFGGAWLDVGAQQIHLIEAQVPPELGSALRRPGQRPRWCGGGAAVERGAGRRPQPGRHRTSGVPPRSGRQHDRTARGQRPIRDLIGRFPAPRLAGCGGPGRLCGCCTT